MERHNSYSWLQLSWDKALIVIMMVNWICELLAGMEVIFRCVPGATKILIKKHIIEQR